MGARGLCKFIETNAKLLRNYRLMNSKLIIDGNNLKHELLCFDYVVNGGDYDTYSKTILFFFTNLLSCNITPYVVFDGADNPDNEKLKTILQRAHNNINSVNGLKRGSHHCSVFPILGSETFRNVLIDHNIQHCTCDFEADEQIVILANEWKCPVLSYDSDFFIYHVTSGYIPFSSLNFSNIQNNLETGTKFMDAKIYYLEDFALHYFENNLSLPLLLPCLLGNDFVSGNIFYDFTESISFPENAPNRSESKHSQKVSKMINWLSKFQTQDDAMDVITRSFPRPKQNDIRGILRHSIEKYQVNRETFPVCLIDYFDASGCVKENLSLQPHPSGFGNTELPHWFISAARRSEVPVFSLNVAINRRVILRCQVEDLEHDSSYVSASSIRKVLYNILIKEQQELETRLPKKSMETKTIKCVEEFDRHRNDMRSSFVDVEMCLDSNLQHGNELPKLSEIPDLILNEKVAILRTSLDSPLEEIPNVSNDSKLFVLVAQFWIKNSRLVESYHIKAIVACHVILRLRSYAEQSVSSERCKMTSLKDEKIFPKCSKHDVDNVISNYEYYKNNIMRYPNFELIHSFSEFQACLLTAIHLNKILMCPLPNSNPAMVFNGSFLLHLSHGLCRKSEDIQDQIIAKLLSRNTPLIHLYQNLLDIINLPKEERKELEISKSCQRRKSKHSVDHDVPVSSNPPLPSITKTSTSQGKAACASINRFSVLSLDEDCP